MKKTLLSLTLAAFTLFGLYIPAHTIDASSIVRIPFAGQIASVMVCCNGIQFSTTGQYLSPAYGTFIMQWATMEPIPEVGLGLYSYWNLTSGEKVLGDGTYGGVCITIVSECESESTVTYTVLQAGTTLYSTTGV